MEHQAKLFNTSCENLRKEVENTDFFLNKVQPISNFTQTVHIMRNVIEEDDQLIRIQELQDQFFKDLASSDAAADIEKYLDKNKDDIEIDQAKSPHFERLQAALETI